MKNLEAAQYITCTPVQAQVLQKGSTGSDLYVQSQTGTGKTAAYLIPVIQQMLTAKDNKRHALILVPTRELAVQVEKEARKLIANTHITAASFYGGVGYKEQETALKNGTDVIIGTPGRIIDLEKTGTMQLQRVGFLVIDEADRMFDMGFYPDLRTLLTVLPPAAERQTMLFSATLNTWVKNLAWEYTIDAQEITIKTDTVTVTEIDQKLFHVETEQKMPLLLGLLQKVQPEHTIIFCNTKKHAEIVAKRLSINGYAAKFLIGDLPQTKRLQILDAFKSGKIVCLAATDVAARGIDVSDLDLVINYDLPNDAENYVHRIGRTARAGKTGTAYSLCSEQDVYNLPAIEQYIEEKIPAEIPCQEDFAQDASAGIYITLDRFEGKPSNRCNSGANQKEKARIVEKNQKRRTEKPVKKDQYRTQLKQTKQKKHSRMQGSVQPDSLSILSFEERMQYYKKQYGQILTAQNKKKDRVESQGKKKISSKINSKAKTADNDKKHTQKRTNKKIDSVQNQPVHHQLKKQKQAVQPQQSRNQAKKQGLLDKIKHFFFR